MANSKDEIPGNEKWNRRYYALPQDIASFADDQIETWAEKFYDQVARDLNLENSSAQEEFSQQKEGEAMKKSIPPRIQLTDRFITAVTYATTLHRDQSRKSTDIPYICHPLGVASLLIEAGCDEDQVVAGLLHDVPEDCGGEPRLADIKQMFGHRVEAIVRGCSDSLTSTEEQKAPSKERKEKHLTELETASLDVLLVTAADKLHNARAIATDLEIMGSQLWDRFNLDQQSIIEYYNKVFAILKKNEVTPKLLNPLATAIAAFSV